MKSLKDAAVEYIEHGFSVFPLLPKGKAPATAHGFKDATDDRKQILTWWNENPAYNIGIATGNGFFVIDIDMKPDKNGLQALTTWMQQHSKFTASVIAQTGGGGYHYYFKENRQVKNAEGLLDGVDVRGDGGYVVAPPSIHKSGKPYTWQFSPFDNKIADATPAVYELLNGSKTAGNKPINNSVPETITEGQRVATMISIAGSLINKGLDKDTVKDAITKENIKKCKPPLTDRELEKEVFPALNRGWIAERPYTGSSKASVHFTLHSAADVEEKPVEWLIAGYIPRYGITTLAGEGGTGKTTMWCNIAASVTTGKTSFFQEVPFKETGQPEKVLVLSAEDSWEHVLKKRLISNGADLNLISFLSPSDNCFASLDFNSDTLKDVIETAKPALVIFDPIQSFVPANMHMGDRNSMRKCFSPLMGYGDNFKTTSLIICHANKMSGVWGRKRIADSSDIWDASRSVLLAGTTPEGLRYISHEKSNWGERGKTVLCKLCDGVPVFKGYTDKTDRDFMTDDSKEQRTRPTVNEAKDYITDLLQDNKEMEVNELIAAAKNEGYTAATIRRAREELKKDRQVQNRSEGFGQDKKFYTSLTAI